MTQSAMALDTDARAAIADALNQSVAETAVATMLAQNFHWNVTGMGFGPLHDLFQKIYEDHFIAQDDLAERIKALDAHAEGTLAGMLAAEIANGIDTPASQRALAAPAPSRLPPAPLAQIGATARMRWGERRAGREL